MRGTAERHGALPAELSSFIGRRRDLQEIKTRLASARLVTLVGFGGVGKTRIALRTAADVERGLPDGVRLVEFGGLSDPKLVAKTVMAAVGLRDESGVWAVSRLIDHLADKRLLLVLDNCEHLIEACAVMAESLLRGAPELRMLATSRQPLGVTGEQVVPIGPLALPAADDATALARVAQAEAVALLLERANAAGADLTVTSANRADVVELVRGLDGIPLAIELAAVRLRTLGLSQLVARLNDRFQLLTGGSTAVPARQQTLEATIRWSYDLLGADERAVLRRLSVFPASFSLEAAERVCGAGTDRAADVLAALMTLVDRSFVTVERSEGDVRYRLHETMRAFALLRLREAGEVHRARRAHLEFFAELCRHADSDGHEADDSARLAHLQELDVEADNIRGALRYCLADDDGAEIGLEMAAGLGRYWANRALSEGVHWIDALLERDGTDEAVRGRALFVRGYLAVTQGDHAAGLRAVRHAETIAEAANDEVLLVRILATHAALLVMAGDVDAARRASTRAQQCADRLNDDVAFIAAAQSEALIASLDGDFERMRDIGIEAARRCREINEIYMISTHFTSAGMASMLLGDHSAAESSLSEALEATLVLDDEPGLVMRLQALASNAAMADDAVRAARLLGAAETLRFQGAYRISPFIQHFVEQATTSAKSKLGTDGYEREFGAGAELDRDEAVALALGTKKAPSLGTAPATSTSPLSRREQEVAELAAHGVSNKEIASRLFVSERTVETHIYHILNKLGLASRTKIADWVFPDSAGGPQ